MSNWVNKLRKGDKLCWSEEPSSIYTFIELNGEKSFKCRNNKGQIISFYSYYYESGRLRKIYIWTDWRKIQNDPGAEFKTNRRRIWYKKNGIKVKSDLNIKDGDIFDLETGLNICRAKWEKKKDENEKEVQNYLNKKESRSGMDLVLSYDSSDIFKAPFYSCVVHCINTDYGIHGFIGKTLDEYYGLKEIYENNLADYRATYKGENTDKAVIAVYKNIISLLVSPPHEKANYEQLERCLHELAWYCFSRNIQDLAMPKICCGKNGLDWGKVRDLIVNTFYDTFNEFQQINPGIYNSYNLYRLVITVYGN